MVVAVELTLPKARDTDLATQHQAMSLCDGAAVNIKLCKGSSLTQRLNSYP